MANLWLKTYTINKIRSWSHTQFSAGSPLYQNVTVSGQKLVDGVEHLRDFDSFDDVKRSWDKVIREMCRQCVIIDATCDMVLEEDTMDVLLSALTDDCIERGLNLKEGGAVYDFVSDLQVGIANLADSLAA